MTRVYLFFLLSYGALASVASGGNLTLGLATTSANQASEGDIAVLFVLVTSDVPMAALNFRLAFLGDGRAEVIGRQVNPTLEAQGFRVLSRVSQEPFIDVLPHASDQGPLVELLYYDTLGQALAPASNLQIEALSVRFIRAGNIEFRLADISAVTPSGNQFANIVIDPNAAVLGFHVCALTDCNSNGVGDNCDVAAGTSQDCNGDLVPDDCQIASQDCNQNGQVDACDIRQSVSADVNFDGLPDECVAATCRSDDDCEDTSPCTTNPCQSRVCARRIDRTLCANGDLDGSGRVTLRDISEYVDCLAGPNVGVRPSACNAVSFAVADIQQDGDVDLRDIQIVQNSFAGEGNRTVIACCISTDNCQRLAVDDCTAAGGTALSPETQCDNDPCLDLVQACCASDGTCSDESARDCLAVGSQPRGLGTACISTTCPYGRYSNEIQPLSLFLGSGPGKALADDITLSGTGARSLVRYNLMVYGGGGGTFNVTATLYTNCPGSGGTPIPGTSWTWSNVPDLQAKILDATPNAVTLPDSFWIVVEFSTTQAGWVLAGPAEIGFTENRFAKNLPPWGCNGVLAPPPDPPPYAGFWANVECVESPQLSGKSIFHDSSPVTPISSTVNLDSANASMPLEPPNESTARTTFENVNRLLQRK